MLWIIFQSSAGNFHDVQERTSRTVQTPFGIIYGMGLSEQFAGLAIYIFADALTVSMKPCLRLPISLQDPFGLSIPLVVYLVADVHLDGAESLQQDISNVLDYACGVLTVSTSEAEAKAMPWFVCGVRLLSGMEVLWPVASWRNFSRAFNLEKRIEQTLRASGCMVELTMPSTSLSILQPCVSSSL